MLLQIESSFPVILQSWSRFDTVKSKNWGCDFRRQSVALSPWKGKEPMLKWCCDKMGYVLHLNGIIYIINDKCNSFPRNYLIIFRMWKFEHLMVQLTGAFSSADTLQIQYLIFTFLLLNFCKLHALLLAILCLQRHVVRGMQPSRHQTTVLLKLLHRQKTFVQATSL